MSNIKKMNDSKTENMINAAYEVHNNLGSGFLEKVYENALAKELTTRGFEIQQQVRLMVEYKGACVGEYVADIVVNKDIILEIKAVQNLIPIHEVQLVNYLTATGIDLGLLINFGSSVQVKRKYRNPTPVNPV